MNITDVKMFEEKSSIDLQHAINNFIDKETLDGEVHKIIYCPVSHDGEIFYTACIVLCDIFPDV